MQIRYLRITNFRGIASLEWGPNGAFCSLIGAGDAGKSTILDAAEAALSSRWFSFSESDFHGCDTSRTISIEITVGELSKALKSDERFGFFVRGWTPEGALRDEPEEGDEPILTVRLTVDATMEPVWELVCDRTDDTRTLSNRDRALFGLVRLAGDDARHLGWGQGSVLARLSGDAKEASGKLAEAYRVARASAKLDEIESLTEASALAEGFAKSLGAYVQSGYGPGLELGRSGLSSGSIALHDGGVPLRLAGLGTRRLATLAIQKSAVKEGAIVLIDEIEHGLEPHRIIGAVNQLKIDQATALKGSKPVGQVLLTTHSDVALGEVAAESIRVVRSVPMTHQAFVSVPASPAPIRALLRHTPRALFSRRILVCEGQTELGMLLGLRQFWPERHDGMPIEQLSAAIADGNGNEAPSIALALAHLGYQVALFRDSDVPLSPDDQMALAINHVLCFEYGQNLNTEQAIFYAATDDLVEELLRFLRQEVGNDGIDNNIKPRIPDLDIATIRGHFRGWDISTAMTSEQVREQIAAAADKKRWFKSQRVARAAAPLIWQVAGAGQPCPLATTIVAAEGWLYG